MTRRRPRWTPARILGAAYKILSLPDTEIRVRELNSDDCVASSSWNDSDNQIRAVQIVVDHTTDGLVRGVLHELQHMLLEPDLAAFSKKMQEEAFRTWDDLLWHHMPEPKVAQWRRAIARKMKGDKRSG